MKILKAIDAGIEKAEIVLMIAAGLGMMIVVCLGVIARNLSLQLTWTEEIARLCFVWGLYVGALYATRRNTHLKMDILSAIITNKYVDRVLDFLQHAGTLIFLIIFAPVLVDLTVSIAEMEKESAILGYPMVIAYLAPTVFAVFSLIQELVNIIQMIRGWAAHKKEDDQKGGTEE